jgi:hypothetical protein
MFLCLISLFSECTGFPTAKVTQSIQDILCLHPHKTDNLIKLVAGNKFIFYINGIFLNVSNFVRRHNVPKDFVLRAAIIYLYYRIYFVNV